MKLFKSDTRNITKAQVEDFSALRTAHQWRCSAMWPGASLHGRPLNKGNGCFSVDEFRPTVIRLSCGRTEPFRYHGATQIANLTFGRACIPCCLGLQLAPKEGRIASVGSSNRFPDVGFAGAGSFEYIDAGAPWAQKVCSAADPLKIAEPTPSKGHG